VVVYAGDALDVLPTLDASSVAAVITDPPYAIGIDTWDRPTMFTNTVKARGIEVDGDAGPMGGFRAWTRTWASQCRRVLKPGGWLVCFGGTRTWHHTALGIEQAGYQIKDQIAWLYTSGVPKSMDMSYAIDQHLGHDRPDRQVTTPHQAMWTTRRVTNKGQPITPEARQWAGWGTALAPAFEPVIVARNPTNLTIPANLLAHHTGAINTHTPESDGRWPKNVALDHDTALALDQDCAVRPGERSGLFPVFRHHPKATPIERPHIDGTTHQTVKPVGLMRWLCTLFAAPSQTILDPFAGTGTTLQAAHERGIDAIGIELDPTNLALIDTRFTHAATWPQPLL
jgi:site-specific DNA-methyltransferase (adenine-specific)